jgi:hypothetical protein
MRDVVVLIPGITGSVLERDGKQLWGLSVEAGLGALYSRGRSIERLRLDEDPSDVDDLGDGIQATRLVPGAHLVPGLWKIDGYLAVGRRLRAAFDLEPGRNYFEFPYDWRRDNRVAARRLAERARRWLARWREESGATDAQLVLVAHSMGGLVARHYLELLGGWRDTRLLITFGTPYRGSPKALDFIANGLHRLDWLAELSAVMRSFTSVYQLLPVYPCYDPGDDRLVRVKEAAGIPNLDRGRAHHADRFHREIERAVALHVEDPGYRADGYRIHPIVGLNQPTKQSARLEGGRVVSATSLDGDDQGGDGTVPRVSATPIELSDAGREVFVAARHASLQNADPVLVQLRGLLDRLDLGSYRQLTGVGVALDLDDLYEADEPVTLRVRPDDPGEDLELTVADAATGALLVYRSIPATDQLWRQIQIGPLPIGVHRVTVAGTPRVQPVSDLFVVG